jgi:signal transduction histidine kinase
VAVCLVVGAQLAAFALRGDLVSPGEQTVLGVSRTLQLPLVVGLILVSAGAFGAASAGFARRGSAERDATLSLLAGASVALAATSVSNLGLTFTSPGWISLREGLRLVAFALVYRAAWRRQLEMRARAARAAAIAERRRLARDLHDGLAQDLAFIAAHGDQIAQHLGGDHPVTVAARRALAISRGAIDELSSWSSASVQDALETVAHELTDRFGIEVAVDVRLEQEPNPHEREHFARIAREAIANAARHGRAEHVIVSLVQTRLGTELRVSDDGHGLARGDGARAREGFGLRSMRERAEALGGYLTVRERTSGGTQLDLVLPNA